MEPLLIIPLLVLVLWWAGSRKEIPQPPTPSQTIERVVTPTVPKTTMAWIKPKQSEVYIDYTTYISSDEWLKSPQRLACIKTANNKCQMCGVPFGLEVHHISYKHLGNELPEQLVLLCVLCHDHTHLMAGKGAKYYPPLRRPNKG